MPRGKPKAGVSDKIKVTVINAPTVRLTDSFTQHSIKSLIERIGQLPEMKGVKIITGGEHGVQFIGSITGKGSKFRGRSPELLILQFEMEKQNQAQLIVSKDMMTQIEQLWAKIKLMPEVKALNFILWDRIYWNNYDLDDDYAPHRFSLTLEYYPPNQGEYDADLAVRSQKNRTSRIRNTVEDALRDEEKKSHA